MSQPIKAGDLVMQVRSCCPQYLGRMFVVGSVENTLFRCHHCEPKGRERDIVFTRYVAGAPIEWVKRIPPLSELDDARQDEGITA